MNEKHDSKRSVVVQKIFFFDGDPMSFKILDINALKKARVEKTPFPYFIIENFIQEGALADVVRSFPQVETRGSFSLNDVSCQGRFAELMEEMQRPELRRAIGEKLGMDLDERPVMITLRGHTSEKDGKIHVDSESKLVTVLLYLNPNWQADGGKLRLLYNQHDLHNYAAEVPPEAGRCLVFKVTDNCWHGHAPFSGERRSIQLNYITSEKEKNRHLKRHRFSAFLKRLFGRKKHEANTPY